MRNDRPRGDSAATEVHEAGAEECQAVKRKKRAWLATVVMALGAFAGVALPLGSAWADLPGTGFVYQGQIKKNGVLVSGQTDLRFKLYDAASGGTQVGSTLGIDLLDILEGRFNVELDFGTGIFVGEARWLEVEVPRW